jgi:phage tail protein X
MVMLAKIGRVAAVGAAVAGVGWVMVASPGVAHAQPPPIPQDINITCPDVAGINYVRDPADSNAYYLCVDGLPQQRHRCPQVTKLIMGTPPKCMPFPHPMP